MHSLSRLLIAAALLAALSAQSYAQPSLVLRQVDVGVSPGDIVADTARGNVHVFTQGQDINFDGNFVPDDGDISAGWYVMDSTGAVIDSTLFNDFLGGYPARIGIDFTEGVVYVPLQNRIASYRLSDQELLDDPFAEGNYVATTVQQSTGWVIASSRSDDFVSPGRLDIIDPTFGGIVASVTSGVNPGMGVTGYNSTRGIGEAHILNEGASGESNASITRFGFSGDIYESVNGAPFDNDAREILTDDSRVFILTPSSSRITVLDLDTHEELPNSPLDFGQIPTNEPHSMAVAGDTLYVTTRTRGVRRFNLANGSQLDSFDVPGVAGGVAVHDSMLFVAIGFGSQVIASDSIVVALNRHTGDEIAQIDVGYRPLRLHAAPDQGGIVVLGSGSEENDEPWWSLISVENLTAATPSPLPTVTSTNTNLKSAYDRSTSTLGIVGGDTLFTLNLTTDNPNPVPLYTGHQEIFANVSVGHGHWFVTNWPGDFVPEPAWLYAVDMESGDLFGQVVVGVSTPVVTSPAESPIDNAIAVYAMTESPWGGSGTGLIYTEFVPSMFEGELGDVGNHIVDGENDHGARITAATMNGSHEITFLDLNESNPRVIESISTGTEGLDGPRASVLAPCAPIVYDGALLVSTYAGETLFMSNGQVITATESGGKGEGITALGDTVFIANAFVTGTYDPETTVAVGHVKYPPGSVNGGDAMLSAFNIGPNPTTGHATARLESNHVVDVEVALYDQLGRAVRTVGSYRLQPGETSIRMNLSGLESGTYYVRIARGETTTTMPITVLR